MNQSFLCEALVLHTYDVGEADRFCLLLTRERGLIAARAQGARKTKSRLGGALLAPNRLTIQLHQGQAGFLITSALRLGPCSNSRTYEEILDIQQGLEALLVLLQEEEPLPEVFAVSSNFAALKRRPKQYFAPHFILKLLYLLGILPHESNHPFYRGLSSEELELVKTATRPGSPLTAVSAYYKNLEDVCDQIINEQSSRNRKVKYIREHAGA